MSNQPKFRWSIESDKLAALVSSQLNSFFPDGRKITASALKKHLPESLQRLQRCFSKIRRKYYFDGETFLFNHLHGDHYASLLYLLGNTIHRNDADQALASKLFLLNKALHGLDLFYAVELPEVFLLIHPIGTVLGNAEYSDYMVVYQNCSIGYTEDGGYPRFGEGVVFYSKSSVLGDSTVGSNVIFGANSLVIDSKIAENSTVVGQYPGHRVLSREGEVVDLMFNQLA